MVSNRRKSVSKTETSILRRRQVRLAMGSCHSTMVTPASNAEMQTNNEDHFLLVQINNIDGDDVLTMLMTLRGKLLVVTAS